MSKKFVSTVCIVLAVVMLLGLVVSGLSAFAYVTQAEIDELEEKRDAIRGQQANIKEQLDALQSDREAVMDRKAVLDEQSELNRQDIALINEQITLYDGMIEEKGQEVEAAAEVEQNQYQRYLQRLRAMEENDNWSYISFIFRATDFADLLSRVDDVLEIITNDQNLEEEYIAARKALEGVKAEYEEVQTRQLAKKEELEDKEQQLEAEISAAGSLITDLEQDIDAYTLVYEQAEADKEEISRQIDAKAAELKAQQEAEERKRQEEERKRAAAAAAAAAASRTTSSGTAQSGTTGSGSSAGAYSSGAASSGYYAWPSYCTYITSRFGYRVHPIFKTTKYHSGVDIAASYGTAVTAAADGTVSIAGTSTGYGNYVTIYHSNGATTLYGHMSSLAVSAGQTVSQGQTIGYVGSTGYATGPHLHFEVRINGSCVDPLQYFNSGSFTYASDA